MGLGFFGAADENLAQADNGMGAGEISIERQRMFTFSDALSGAPGEDVTKPSEIWPRAWSGTEDKALVSFASAAANEASGSGAKKRPPHTHRRAPGRSVHRHCLDRR